VGDEADLARQRFMHVDPKNRLVADSLEADWNDKIRLLNNAREHYQRHRDADRFIVDDEQRRRALALATEFPTVWRDPNTPDRERKRMLALLIEDVTLTKKRQVTAAVRFRGGATTTLTLPRPLTAYQLRATRPEVREQIDQLLDDYSDAHVAHILNQRGLRTGAGDEFDALAVRWVRSSTKLPSLKQRLIAAGMMTTPQLGKLGQPSSSCSASNGLPSVAYAAVTSSRAAFAMTAANGSTGRPPIFHPPNCPQTPRWTIRLRKVRELWLLRSILFRCDGDVRSVREGERRSDNGGQSCP